LRKTIHSFPHLETKPFCGVIVPLKNHSLLTQDGNLNPICICVLIQQERKKKKRVSSARRGGRREEVEDIFSRFLTNSLPFALHTHLEKSTLTNLAKKLVPPGSLTSLSILQYQHLTFNSQTLKGYWGWGLLV
jgi:hypothetical protein